jgi:hypothetical protein
MKLPKRDKRAQRQLLNNLLYKQNKEYPDFLEIECPNCTMFQCACCRWGGYNHPGLEERYRERTFFMDEEELDADDDARGDLWYPHGCGAWCNHPLVQEHWHSKTSLVWVAREMGVHGATYKIWEGKCNWPEEFSSYTTACKAFDPECEDGIAQA